MFSPKTRKRNCIFKELFKIVGFFRLNRRIMQKRIKSARFRLNVLFFDFVLFNIIQIQTIKQSNFSFRVLLFRLALF